MAGEMKYRLENEHIYDGLPFSSKFTAEVMDTIKEMDFTGDIILASYPKTGTTWLQEMVWLIMNDADFTTAKDVYVERRVPFMELQVADYLTLDEIMALPHPITLKTHLQSSTYRKQLSTLDFKVIIPIRNPKDTLVSYYHFHRMVDHFNFKGSWSDFFDIVKSKHMYCGDYFDWYMGWLQYRDHPNVKIVKYEDMKLDLKSTVKEVAEFLERTLHEETITSITDHLSFDKMKENKMTNHSKNTRMNQDISPFMRKGVVGDWKNYFTPDQSKYIDERYEGTLKQIGIELQFE